MPHWFRTVPHGLDKGQNQRGTKWPTNYIILLYKEYRTEPRPPGGCLRAPKAPWPPQGAEGAFLEF